MVRYILWQANITATSLSFHHHRWEKERIGETERKGKGDSYTRSLINNRITFNCWNAGERALVDSRIGGTWYSWNKWLRHTTSDSGCGLPDSGRAFEYNQHKLICSKLKLMMTNRGIFNMENKAIKRWYFVFWGCTLSLCLCPHHRQTWIFIYPRLLESSRYV